MGVRGEILRHLIKKQNSLCGAGLLIGGEDREDEGRGEETVSVWRNCLKRCSIQAEDRGRGLAELVLDLGARAPVLALAGSPITGAGSSRAMRVAIPKQKPSSPAAYW